MDDDMEDYGFEYSDEEPEEGDVDIENQYYNSKGMLEQDDPRDALDGFRQVVAMESSRGEWGFKALKQIVKLLHRMGDRAKMMEAYRQMLEYADSAVTRNAAEKKINSLLDHVSAAPSADLDLLQEFYETTLRALEKARNDRLWFKTNLKLCNLWFRAKEYGRMSRILKDLHRSCQREDGSEDLKKGTQLLEVYAVEIQMHTEQRNNKKLKQLYHKALGVKSAIPHPRILGIVRECGGKMNMHDQLWPEAATDFFEAFKSYDEAGSPRRVQCLKYMVLASMLMESKVDPFDAQEARPYRQDPEVAAMTCLVQAYQASDIREFERVLRENKRTVMDDPFIKQYVEDLLRKIRTQVLLKLVRPYTRVRLASIAQALRIPEGDVEALLVAMILDGRIEGHVDQVNALFEVGDRASGGGGGGGAAAAAAGSARYVSMGRWADQLKSIHASVCNRVA